MVRLQFPSTCLSPKRPIHPPSRLRPHQINQQQADSIHLLAQPPNRLAGLTRKITEITRNLLRSEISQLPAGKRDKQRLHMPRVPRPVFLRNTTPGQQIEESLPVGTATIGRQEGGRISSCRGGINCARFPHGGNYSRIGRICRSRDSVNPPILDRGDSAYLTVSTSGKVKVFVRYSTGNASW